MISKRCKLIVKRELDNIGVIHEVVNLGEVYLPKGITPEQRKRLSAVLQQTGLEVMNDRKAILVDKIKSIVIETIHNSNESVKMNLTQHLSEKLNCEYTYLANLFSEAEGITIERFIITHRIERVKELMIADEMPLTEIAYKLHYSSVAHLSSQFKKVTGLAPTYYKKLKHLRHRGDKNDRV